MRRTIFNRETGEVTYGRVPAGSGVVSCHLPSKDGSFSLYCAGIVKQRDAKTRYTLPNIKMDIILGSVYGYLTSRILP
jgi:2,3,4,5-tetrahydropyridine-2,6-dicarboxylate N-succinyltransferase